MFATARSIRPSRLKSAATTSRGVRPAVRVAPVWKAPLPALMWMVTGLAAFATAKSGRPSPLKSATASSSKKMLSS
jgi:hypothetical protein